MKDLRKWSDIKQALLDYHNSLTMSRYLTEEDCRNARFAVDGALYALEYVPAVDAVEVVRCRECKYWGDEDGKLQRSDGVIFARCKVHNYLLDGRHTGWCPTDNDFCSYGERKEGADNG